MSRSVRETPVLSRKRKGDRGHQYAGSLLLNPLVISASPHLSRSRSIQSLGSQTSSANKSALRFKEKGLDWTRQKQTDAASEETENIYRNTTGWMSSLLKKVVHSVTDKFAHARHDEDDDTGSDTQSSNKKEQDLKKRKVVLDSHKESPLKAELENSTFLPTLNPKEDDIKFNKSPIDWELEKLVNEEPHNANPDYGTQLIRRKNKYQVSNPTAGYLRSVFKGTYKSPTPKDASPPTPSSSTSLSSLDNKTNILTSIQKLADILSHNFGESSSVIYNKKKDDEDLIVLKEVKATPSRHSLKFDYTELTFEKETSYYQNMLKQRRELQEQAHRAKLKAQESKLSPEDENKLRDIWKSRGKDEHKLITAFNIDVRVVDFKTLADGRWLNDVVIEVFLKTLDNNKIHTFNSYFYTTLEERGYAGVKKWMKRAKKDISKLQLILCPINVHGTHWVLGVINIKDRKILYMDSLATSKNSFSIRALENMKLFIQGEAEKQGFSKLGQGYELIHVVDCPQQRNGFDCGVFTLLNAKRIAEGKALDYSSNYPTQFRREIALKILSLAAKSNL